MALQPLENIYSPGLANQGGGVFMKVDSYSVLIRPLIQDALIALGVFALFSLIFAGYTFINSGGDKAKVEQATNTITYVIIGLVLASTIFLLTNIVGKFMGFDIFNPTI